MYYSSVSMYSSASFLVGKLQRSLWVLFSYTHVHESYTILYIVSPPFMEALCIFIPLFPNYSLSVCKISGWMRNYFLDISLGALSPVAFHRLTISFDKGMLQPYVYFYGIHTCTFTPTAPLAPFSRFIL